MEKDEVFEDCLSTALYRVAVGSDCSEDELLTKLEFIDGDLVRGELFWQIYQYLDVWTPDRVDAALTEKCNNV